MAEMLIECTTCHTKYQADQRMAGKRVRCKHCGSIFDVPPLESPPVDESADQDDLSDLAALAGPGDQESELGVDTDIRVHHPNMPAGSQLTGGYSRMERTRDTDGYDLASNEPFDDRRPNTPFVFAGSREVDDWLPWVLIVGGLAGSAWFLFSWGPQRPIWMNLLRPAVYIGLFLAIIHPLGLMGLNKGLNRARLCPPGSMGLRALGIFSVPLFLGVLLWTAGGDIGALVMGVLVGLILAVMLMWLLLRLNPQELAPVGISGSAAFIAGMAIVVALIVGANYGLLAALRSQQKLAVVTASPLGETLPWEAAPVQPIAMADGKKNADNAHAGAMPETSSRELPPTTRQAQEQAVGAPVDQNNATASAAAPPQQEAPAAPGTDQQPPPPAETPKNASAQTPVEMPDSKADDAKVLVRNNTQTPAVPSLVSPPFKSASPIVKTATPLDAMGDFADVIYPKTTSDHLAVIRTRGKDGDVIETWTLDPPKRVGLARFNHAPNKIDHYILSPDGDLLARIVDWPKPSVQIWSFSGEKVLRSIDLNDQLGEPFLLGFVNPRQFVLQWSRGGVSGMEYLDAFTGRSLRQINLSPGRRSAGSFAFGPKGLFIATPSMVNQTPCITLYSFPTGQAARQFKLKDLDPRGPIEPAGMAFSPDGSRLAVLFEQYGNGLLLCWNLFGYSQQPLEHLYPNGFGFNVDDKTQGTAIQWLDQGAWLLWGRGIFDTDTGKPIGRIGLDHVINQRLIKPRMIQLMVPGNEANSRRMVNVQVNSEQLTSAKQAAAQ